MDQDGFNNKFLTLGNELVLTPRFNPTSQMVTIFLENHTHLASGPPKTTRIHQGNIFSIMHNFPRRWFYQSVDAANQGAFTRSRWTDQGKYLPFGNRKTDSLESFVPGIIFLAEIL